MLQCDCCHRYLTIVTRITNACQLAICSVVLRVLRQVVSGYSNARVDAI